MDIKIVSVDGVRGAFEAVLAGELNCTVECTPLLAQQIFDTAAALKAGETVDKWIVSADDIYTADKVTQETIDSRTY